MYLSTYQTEITEEEELQFLSSERASNHTPIFALSKKF